MDEILMPGVKLTPLTIIALKEGDVLHAAKISDAGLAGFGEAYFSKIRQNGVKAWKRHSEMTLNLVVPVGEIRFVLYDDRLESPACEKFFSVNLSLQNYQRLTVPPMIWMGFQGIGNDLNLLLNIASIPHDPQEADRLEISSIRYDW
jgi:dTDP-4-dehydrorhamnose 3,5-epimerase